MSDYTQITDFSAKDALASGDANKKILGSDVDAEFAAIATAVASKADDNVVVKTSGTQTVAGDKTFSGNNTHSGNNTFSGVIVDDLTIESDDAGATVAPKLILHRDSASPAASDVLGATDYDGEDSGGNQTTYARTQGEIVDPTDTSEDGRFAIQSVIAGTLATRIYVGNGLYTVGASDKGANTINASSGVFDNGNRLAQILLATETASNSASLIFNSSDFDWSLYDIYIFEGVKLVPASNDVSFEANISTDDGSTWKTTYQAGGVYQESTTGPFTPTAFGSATSTNIPLSTGTSNGVINTNTGPFNFTLKVTIPSAALYPSGTWTFDFRDSTNGLVTGSGAFHYTTAGAWNAIRFLFSSGNIASGSIHAYALKS